MDEDVRKCTTYQDGQFTVTTYLVPEPNEADMVEDMALENDIISDNSPSVENSFGDEAMHVLVENVSLVVLDCANIGWNFNVGESFSAIGVKVAIDYFNQWKGKLGPHSTHLLFYFS